MAKGPERHGPVRVQTDYSKPSADIRAESVRRFRHDAQAYAQQQQTLKTVGRASRRRRCVVCDCRLAGDAFLHRGLSFVSCARCGHVQSVLVPRSDRQAQFDVIYPALGGRRYRERRDRIYTPKLEWIVRSLGRLGMSPARLRACRWTEIGAGAGYFLSALDEYGVKDFAGFDGNRRLAATANRALGANRVRYEADPNLGSVITRHPADIYVAFFVLEHIDDAHAFFGALRRLPKGTVFVFSVPVFGFSVLLDGAFEHNFARQLDGIVHRQLYTDQSIRHAMKVAGFAIVAEWIFGQDADDLSRFLLQSLSRRCSARAIRGMAAQLAGVQDGIQHVLDRARLGDQRHVIAIRR